MHYFGLTSNSRCKTFQAGISLIEVLVALLIFSLGILGLVGVQVTAARTTADAGYRSQAAAFANTLLNQMRAGNPATLAADYDIEGEKWITWRDELIGASGLPGAITHPPEINITDVPPVVTLTIYWAGVGETVPHSYVTVATIN